MTRPNFSTSLIATTKRQSSGVADASFTTVDGRLASETITGVSRRRPKGWIPPTAYQLLRREVNRAMGTCDTGVTTSNWSKYSGCVGGTGGRFNSLNHFDEAVSESAARQTLSTSAALVAARNRLKDTKVNLGVAFAERKATAMTVGDTATRIARSVHMLRRGLFRNAARELGIRYNDIGKPKGSNWTNHWLQLQYGWKPLLSDIYGSCDALSKRDSGDFRVTAKASRRDTDSWSVTRSPLGATYPTGNFDASTTVARRTRGVFVRIDALPQNDLKMSLTSLGLTNPLLVAWEVVPYSFVVDWFLPVGSWLESLDALCGYGPAWTSISTMNEIMWEDVGLSKSWSSVAYIRNNFLGTKRLLEVKRSASSGVPLPAFPRFKDPLSLGHMANGLSLLAQAFGRR